MKALLYTLLGIALISSIGYGTFLNYNDQNDDLQTSAPNPYISFVNPYTLDSYLTSILKGQTESVQLQSIKSFIFQQRKFFNGGQIMNILNQVVEPNDNIFNGSPRKTVISLIKPYIGPLSTDEAIQILMMINRIDGIVSSIITNQIYDLQGKNVNGTNLGSLLNTINGSLNINKDQIILPQYSKNIQYNFLLTFEGKHVGFLIDQSESMSSIAYTKTDGTTVTRYAMLQEFFQKNSFDIFYNFLEFSYIFLGNQTSYSWDSISTSFYESTKGITDEICNRSQCGGQNDLYLKLSQILNKPYSTISDLYIWSDGMVPQGAQGVSDFIKLIDSINAQRRNKIRINTVSFLFGGNEDVATRTAATTLLQTLADYTEGTFIQVLPNFN